MSVKEIIFTSTTTWTCPPNVFSVIVEVIGGGGAGGIGSGNPSGGGGGAGGAYARSRLSVTPGTVYTITCGAAVTSGNAGNPSWFGAVGTIYAEGGVDGGDAASNNQSAAGGTKSKASTIGNLVTNAGGTGGTGSSGASGGGGGSGGNRHGDGVDGGVTTGALSQDGGGNGGDAGITTSNGGVGNPGVAPGGGGGGGRAGSNTDRAGGNGAAGQVKIFILYPDMENYKRFKSTLSQSGMGGGSIPVKQ